jgi:hypothetical protein
VPRPRGRQSALAHAVRVARVLHSYLPAHQALTDGLHVPPVDPAVLVVSTADKLVSIRTVLDGAASAADAATYWRSRQGFVLSVPYLRSFHCAAAVHVPVAMADDLRHLISQAEPAATRREGA